MVEELVLLAFDEVTEVEILVELPNWVGVEQSCQVITHRKSIENIVSKNWYKDLYPNHVFVR